MDGTTDWIMSFRKWPIPIIIRMENTVPPATDGFPLILLPNVLMFIFFFFERHITVSKETPDASEETSGASEETLGASEEALDASEERRLFKRAVVDVSKVYISTKG